MTIHSSLTDIQFMKNLIIGMKLNHECTQHIYAHIMILIIYIIYMVLYKLTSAAQLPQGPGLGTLCA